MDFSRELTICIPRLRKYAFTLCRDAVLVEDLVQETCLKAWKARDRYRNTSEPMVWLGTILRYTYISHYRRQGFEIGGLVDPSVGEAQVAPDDPEWSAHFADFLRALKDLPLEQREALLLIAYEGLEYRDAAKILEVQVGTVQSRVSRARARLLHRLQW